MSEIAELQLMKPNTASDGTDIFRGIKSIRGQTNDPEIYQGRLEGELRASIREQVETDRPPVEGQMEFSSAAAKAELAGKEFDEFTVLCKDIVSGEAKEVVFENIAFKTSTLGIGNKQVDGMTLNFEATDYSIDDAST